HHQAAAAQAPRPHASSNARASPFPRYHDAPRADEFAHAIPRRPRGEAIRGRTSESPCSGCNAATFQSVLVTAESGDALGRLIDVGKSRVSRSARSEIAGPGPTVWRVRGDAWVAR